MVSLATTSNKDPGRGLHIRFPHHMYVLSLDGLLRMQVLVSSIVISCCISTLARCVQSALPAQLFLRCIYPWSGNRR